MRADRLVRRPGFVASGACLARATLLVLAVAIPGTALRAQDAAPAPDPEPAATPAAPAPSSAAGDVDLAEATITELYDTLTSVMRRGPELGRAGRTEVLAPAVARAYDMDFMAAKALGRHWKSLPEDARARWRRAFEALTVTTYTDRFEEDLGQRLVVEDAEPARRGTVLVHTRIDRPDDDPVEINYRMRETDGTWRIIDIYLNGTVSELALRRSEYTTVIERDGFDHLVESIEAKNVGDS